MELKKYAKQRVQSESGVNLKKLLGANAVAGLGVGFGKRYTDQKIRDTLLKRIPKMSLASMKGIANALTSAGAGVAFGLATAYGMKKSKKK